MLRTIYYLLNSDQRLLIRRFIYFPLDFMDKLIGKKDKLIPEKGLIYTGRGNFKEQGEQFFKYFLQYGDLKPDYQVLEIGCGIGRMALPLLGYLNEKGSYKGFDIVKKGIEWCNRNIASNYPAFKFFHCNIYNELYNSKGEILPNEFIFPFNNNEFDFAILASVFTHMLEEEVIHYLDELSRVMNKGARAFITLFLLNYESQSLMISGKKSFMFPYKSGNYSTMRRHPAVGNVAYKEEFIYNETALRNFKIIKTLPGSWCGRRKGEYTDFQDIMILQKI